jgi:general stress protein 26
MKKPQNLQNMPTPGRPRFPNGYGFTPETPHSPPDWNWVINQIAGSRNYWICTASREGKPHAMPVWGVWGEDTLYFVTKRASKKARNLFENPQVVVHLESGDDVIVLEGIALELKSIVKLGQVAKLYSEKYKGDQIFHDIESVFELQAKVIFSWLERDFHHSATRWTYGEDAGS